ncbi:hypothetical protein [Streptomyces sp. NPDC002057]|uniref:hypothetical protein n=1 Tax=Streptomyces sp. NPDC002057 TaxID=3154664 RepID=UPI0033214EA1
MTARTVRPLALTAAAALTLGGATLAGAPAAFAAPGDNGDIKIHRVGTSFTDQRNEPRVCTFYLAAFNFDTLQEVDWEISRQPSDNGPVRSGELTLAAGTGHTAPLSLPNGQYKLVWTFEGQTGTGKQKVFRVACPGDVITNPPPTGGNGDGGSPNGTGANGTGNNGTANGTGNGTSNTGDNWNGTGTGNSTGNGTSNSSGDNWNGTSNSNSNSNGGSANANGNGDADNWNGDSNSNGNGRPPQGPVGAGGGGSVQLADEDSSAFGVGAAVAAGLAGTAGLVLIRRSRRRNDGAA